MGSNGKFRGLRVLRLLALAGLTLSLLVTPSVRAGHLATSPTQEEQVADPGTVDGVAIRGTTARSSPGPDDVPVGIAGRATGDASGTDSNVNAVRADATGSALGGNSEVDGVLARATGNASGVGSEVVGLRAVVTGNATGQDADVVGVVGVAKTTSGDAIGVRGRSNSATGTGVVGNATATSGPATGVRGRSDSTSGIGVLGRAPFRGVVGLAQATSGFTIAVEGQDFSPDGSAVFGRGNATSGPARGVVGESLSSSGIGVHGRALATSGNPIAVWGESPTSNGIGVQGSSGPGGIAGLFQGKVQILCSTPPCLVVNTTTVLDLAETLPLVARVAPGDVVVLAEGRGGYGVAPASRPYDTRVAGIVSAHPPIVLQNRQSEVTAPVAMVGIVRAKATAADGAIRIGDLLTTSRIAGHLMRCPTALQCVGAVVGKALEPLAKGEKEILVMLWRQ